MKRNYLVILIFIYASTIIVSLIFGLYGWINQSTMVKWAAPAIALGVLAVGLSVISFMIAVRIDAAIEGIKTVLENIEQKQQEIKREQERQAGSQSPIIASLTGLSKYLEFMTKEQEEQK